MEDVFERVHRQDESADEGSRLNLLDISEMADLPVKQSWNGGAKSDLSEAEKPVPRNTEKWRTEHSSLSQKSQTTEPSLVFYGDSITKGMSEGNALKKAFGNSAENFGIIGDSTQHLLWRLQNGEANFKKPPEKGVLLIGANNVGHQSNDDIVKGILADLKEAQKRMPDTKWLVLGVLPQGRNANDPRRAEIKDINEKLAQALKGMPNVQFFDAGPAMLEKDGSMSDRVWWRDGLHPRNYDPLFDKVKEQLKKF